MAELTDVGVVEVDTADMTDDDMLAGRQGAVAGLARYTLGKLKAYFLSGGATLPPGGTVGQVLTKIDSTDGNADWEDPTGGGGGGGGSSSFVPPRTRLELSADVACTNDTDWHVLPFDTEIADTLGAHEGVTNPGRITIPDGVTKVNLSAHVIWTGVEAGNRIAAIAKNGEDYPYALVSDWSPRNWVSGRHLTTGWIECVPGDYFVILTSQNSAVSYAADGIGAGGCFFEALFDDGSAGGGASSLYRFGSFFTAAPGADEVLMMHPAADNFTLPLDLTGSQFLVGDNPGSTVALSLQVGDDFASLAEVGTVSISAAGAVTFDTSGVEIAVTTGQLVALIAPADSDGLANCSWTFRSTGAVSSGGGTAWDFLPPLAADFAFTDDGTNAVLTDDADVGLIFDFGAPVAGDKLRMFHKTIAVPTADWTLTTRCLGFVDGGNYTSFGVALYDSTSTKQYTFGLSNDGHLRITKWAAGVGGAFNSNLYDSFCVDTARWFRVVHTGGNYDFYVSMDGKSWVFLATESDTGWLTSRADKVGIGVKYTRTTGAKVIGSVPYFKLEQ